MADKSIRHVERIIKIILTIISLLFAFFLIMFGTILLRDMGSWGTKPELEDYLERSNVSNMEAAVEDAEKEADFIEDSLKTNQAGYENAQKLYREEKDVYENWLATRAVLKDKEQNAVVLEKTRLLESYKDSMRSWSNAVQKDTQRLKEKRSEIESLRKAEADARSSARKDWDKAYSMYKLKIFAVRLLFVCPLLALAIFLVIKYRTRKFAAFIWGYAVFVLWAFFFGLIPYLPSFGGYVQYGVGIVLTVVVGYYVIKYTQSYVREKQEQARLSSEERSKKIAEEAALRSYTMKVCPSCEHSYMPSVTKASTLPSFCSHCGLELFSPCKNCGEVNFVHFNFCWKCGADLKKKNTQEK